jgi:hypothetical protein
MPPVNKRISYLALLTILLSSMSLAQARPLTQTDTPGNDDPLIARLDRETGGHVQIAFHAETGMARFIGADLGHTIPGLAGLAASATPEQVARGFMSSYGALFGVADQARAVSSTAIRYRAWASPRPRRSTIW